MMPSFRELLDNFSQSHLVIDEADAGTGNTQRRHGWFCTESYATAGILLALSPIVFRLPFYGAVVVSSALGIYEVGDNQAE
jgi:hypothetical protein